MPALNPFSPPHPTILRSRYWKSPGKWEEVTADHRYEDGGISFNEQNDDAPVEFEVAFTGLTLEEAAVFDAHFEETKYSTLFDFDSKDDLRYPVYYKKGSYQPDHDGHKSWRQTRRMVLVYYPGNGAITDISATMVTANSGADFVTANSGADNVIVI